MKNQLRFSAYLAIFYALFSISAPCFGQSIDLAGAATQVDFIKHGAESTGSTNLLTIGLTNVGVGPITWQYCEGAGCTSFSNVPTVRTTIVGGMEIQAISTTQVRIFATSLLEGEHSLTIRAKQGAAGTYRAKTFRIIGRKPMEMVFVLDMSGSMECEPLDDVPTQWDGCIVASPNRRWDKLKNAVNQFMAKLNDGNHDITGDSYSVAYFSGSNTNPASTFINLPGTRFVNFSTFRSGIGSDMTGQEDASAPVLMRDGTSIGTGLNEALNQRFGGTTTSTTKRRVIVLLSDGEENRDPKVYISGSNREVKTGPGGTVLADLNAFTDLEIFSIGFGSSLVSLPALLSQISPGKTFFTLTGQEATFLDEISNYAFDEIFNAFSPNLIRYEDKKLAMQNSASFVCNDHVPQLFFEASFEKPVARNYTYLLSRDGLPIDSFRLTVGDYFATLALQTDRLPDQKSGGTWTLTCTSSNGNSSSLGTKLRLSATADDHALELICNPGQPAFKVGDTMKPSVRLSYNGAPVTNATVTAVVIRPGDDLGNLLARATVPALPAAHPEEGGCGEMRYAYLNSNNPMALAAYKQLKNDTIQLTHTGNGVYEGSMGDVDVTGVYKLFYHATSNVADAGTIERMKVQTSYVRFGAIDYYTNKIRKGAATFNSDNLNGLNFRPSYQNNQNETTYVGPGFSQFINVEGRTGQYLEVTDLCDGSYELKFFAKPNDPIRITMLDELIFKGPAKSLNDPYPNQRFGLSMHAGSTRPLESLDSLYNAGVYVEADFSYRFLPNFSAELVGGHYRFKDNYYINGLSLYAKGHFTVSTALEGYAGAGVGIYQPKSESWNTGFSLRGGLMYRLNAHWAGLADFGYFNAPTPQNAFLTLGLGVKYLF